MSYKDVVLADNPIRYYRMDGLSTLTVKDIGSQAQNGTISGGITLGQSALISGDSDTAMLFDGLSGQISLPVSGLPSGSNAWSVEVWVNIATITGNFECIILWGGSAYNILTGFGASGSFYFQLYDGATGLTANPRNLNTTYHLVGTYDGVNLRLYINGALEASTPVAQSMTVTGAFIGNNGSDQPFSGLVDEVAYYNYALSASRILAHYDAGIASAVQETAQAFGWLYSTMTGDSALTAAATGGVWQGFADIGTTGPYVLFLQQSSADTLTMNARRLFTRGLFQIKAVGPTSNYAALVTIADRIDVLFKSVSSVALASGGILECYREQSYAADYPVNGQAWSELGGLYNIDLQAN